MTNNKGHPLSLLFDFLMRLFALLKDTLFDILTLIFGNQKNPPIMENAHSKAMPFKIDFEGNVDKKLPLKVFVFDHYDNLLESHLLDGTDFHLKTDDHTLQHAQIFIAPIADGIALNPQPLPPQLKAIGAYRPVLTFDAKRTIQRDLLPIPEYIWKNWYFCICRVRGQVVKPFYIPRPFGGNFTFRMPVCHARVHICRLENFIFTLKDSDIFKLRDDLLTLKQPIPKPGPVVTPRFFDFHTMETMSIASTNDSNLAQAEATTFSSPFSTTFQNKLQTNSVGALRQVLADNFQEIQYFPHFCWLHRCVELSVVETDESGYFDTSIWESCFNPNHNYYMWVEYLIDGVWQSVYAPDYCSGAFWNYACGSEVTLTVTDPRVPFGCRPTQTGSIFEVVRIGASGFISEIQQPAANATTFVRAALNNGDGLIDWVSGDDAHKRPFGSQLDIYANFGDGFPSANATHYRISYKKHAEDNTKWAPLTTSLSRWYRETVTISGIPEFIPREFPLLDADGVGYYKIPHNEAKNQPGLNSTCEWYVHPFKIGELNTLPLDNTHYDIRIELYKKSGATYQLANVAKTVYQMPVLNAAREEINSTPCADNYLTLASDGSSLAFMMTIRVDNNKCTAVIENATIDGSAAGDDCGFLNYKAAASSAQLAFKANHPNDFATYDFRVVRGNNNHMAGFEVQGQVSDTTVATLNGYSNVNTGTPPPYDRRFSKAANVADLVAGLPAKCQGKAAFAQRLLVYATATDGTYRLSVHDAPEQLAAFAIVPA